MSAVRTINAEHVELVLMAIRARRLNPELARFAAISNGTVGTSCHRRSTPQSDAPRAQPLLWPMLSSVSPNLVERTRMHYGLPEVKRTWGVGYKAMLAELKGGAA